ncbi:MAG: hypothetical protein ACXACW_12560 [Candidatus Hodarchaeales archaeon]|jgi:hypothetical protein
MSQREREISDKIASLEKEKKILEGTRAYYEQNLSYSDLEELSGISIREFKRFQSDNEFPYRVGSFNRQAIYNKIQQRTNDIIQEIGKLRGSVFGALDQLLFIPSWQNMIDSSFNGFYLNQPVQKIFQDTRYHHLPTRASYDWDGRNNRRSIYGNYWIRNVLGKI